MSTSSSISSSISSSQCIPIPLPHVDAAGSGQLHLIFGPMFSGKSTELLRRIRRCSIAKMRCLIIKYNADKRYSESMFSTHDKQMSEAFSSGSELSHLKTMFDDYDVIGIDEGQFFIDIEEFCEEAVNAGKVVIIAACDATFQKKPFGKVLQLVPLSDSVIKLCAVCVTCFRDAPFSARLSNEEALEIIGGAEKYAAMCRRCHNHSLNEN